MTRTSRDHGQPPSGGFHGRTERERQTSSLRFVLASYERGAQLPRHEHDNAHLCLVLDGGYEERIGSRTFERNSLDLIWYPREADHAEAFRSSGRHLMVEFTESPVCALPNRVVSRGDSTTIPGAMNLVRLLLQVGDPNPLELDEAVALIVARLEPGGCEEARQPRWIPRVKRELSETFANPVSLQHLARIAGVSAPHLARTWRRFQHETLGESLRALRVEFACRELAKQERSLSEIALEAGFSDQSHLGRVLRQQTGFSPAALRRTLRS